MLYWIDDSSILPWIQFAKKQESICEMYTHKHKRNKCPSSGRRIHLYAKNAPKKMLLELWTVFIEDESTVGKEWKSYSTHVS